MFKAMEIYYDVGFDSFFIDDHVPQTFQDTAWGHRGRAFANGYIQALIEAVTKQRQAAGIVARHGARNGASPRAKLLAPNAGRAR